MFLNQVNWGYYITYTTVDIVVVEILFDSDFINSLLQVWRNFAAMVLLPEPIGKYYTETRYLQAIPYEATEVRGGEATCH